MNSPSLNQQNHILLLNLLLIMFICVNAFNKQMDFNTPPKFITFGKFNIINMSYSRS